MSVFFFFWCVCACVCSVVCVCVCVSETLCLPPEPARVYQSVSCLFITECGIISCITPTLMYQSSQLVVFNSKCIADVIQVIRIIVKSRTK